MTTALRFAPLLGALLLPACSTATLEGINCAQQQGDGGTTACLDCCAGQEPEGHNAFVAAQKACSCSGGSCESACGTSSLCTMGGPDPSDACTACVKPALDTGGTCEAAFQMQCASGSKCDRFVKCTGACKL